MGETKMEYLHGQLQARRRDFLREFDVSELIDLFGTLDEAKEVLIEEIINNNYDAVINEQA